MPEGLIASFRTFKNANSVVLAKRFKKWSQLETGRARIFFWRLCMYPLIGLRENLNRKPSKFSHESWDVPVNFPLNQSIEGMFRSAFIVDCPINFPWWFSWIGDITPMISIHWMYVFSPRPPGVGRSWSMGLPRLRHGLADTRLASHQAEHKLLRLLL